MKKVLIVITTVAILLFTACNMKEIEEISSKTAETIELQEADTQMSSLKTSEAVNETQETQKSSSDFHSEEKKESVNLTESNSEPVYIVEEYVEEATWRNESYLGEEVTDDSVWINNIEETEIENWETESDHFHDFVIVWQEFPAAHSDGYITYECSCGEQYSEIIPRTGNEPHELAQMEIEDEFTTIVSTPVGERTRHTWIYRCPVCGYEEEIFAQDE